MRKIWEIVMASLSTTSEVSEKRITRMVVVIILLMMTVADLFLYAKGLRIEILMAWLGFAGYDGYRITQEKKNLQDSAVKTADIKAQADITKEAIKKDG